MAHGLVLRMQDYLEKLNIRKESTVSLKEPSDDPIEESDVSSEEVQIIKSWLLVTKNPRNSKMEFFSLLRQTLLFMLSPKWTKCTKQNDLLHAFSCYYRKFSTITKNAKDVYSAVLRLSNDPWQNDFFCWEDLFLGKITVEDQSVQDYFRQEPEEIVLARVQSFATRRNLSASICLAKLSFLYYSRINQSLADPESPLPKYKEGFDIFLEETSQEGHASIDWFVAVLEQTKSLSLITREVSELTCHEGVEMVCRLRRNPQSKRLAFTLLQIFLIQDIIKPSKYCCTEKLFILFCIMHKELNSSSKDIIESAQKIVTLYAPTSAHLYLFVEIMSEQFGPRYTSLYVEFYIRGLTADLNYREVGNTSKSPLDYQDLDRHIAAVLAKFATFFVGVSEEASRECLFSAFVIMPSVSRYNLLMRINSHIDMREMEKSDSSNNHDLTYRECTCSRICNGYCKTSTNENDFTHPILKKGIRSIPYLLVKDFVTVLESMRCIKFQYNSFCWENPRLTLHAFLKASPKSDYRERKQYILSPYRVEEPESTKDSHSNEVPLIKTIEEKLSPQGTPKRKNSFENSNNMHFLDVGANIEVNDDESMNKKIKLLESVNTQSCIAQESYNSTHISKVKVNDAIEKVIRMSLTDKINKEKSCVLSNATTFNMSDVNRSLSLNNRQECQQFPPSDNCNSILKRELQSKYLSNFADSIQSPVLRNTGKTSVSERKNFILHERANFLQKKNSMPGQKVTSGSVQLLDSTKEKSVQPLLAYESKHKERAYNLPYQESRPTKYVSISQIRDHTNENTNQAIYLNSKNQSETRAAPKFYLQTPPSALQHPLDLQCNKKLKTQTSENTSFTETKAFSTFQNKTENIHTEHAHASELTPSVSSKEQVDRNSVIHHTMQHLGIKIPNQLSVSLNSNDVQHLRNEKNFSNLSPFKVNVPNKTIFKNKMVTANLVISNQSPSTSNLEKQELITIPGFLASPSVIKPPTWSDSPKTNNLEYRKVTQTTTSTVKKMYCEPLVKKPMHSSVEQKELIKKTEKITKQETIYQIYKSKKNATLDSYTNKHEENSSSTSVNPNIATTSSQLWYSTPYNKADNSVAPSSSYSDNNYYQVNKSNFEKPSIYSHNKKNDGPYVIEFSEARSSHAYKNTDYRTSSNSNQMDSYIESFPSAKEPSDFLPYSVIKNPSSNNNTSSPVNHNINSNIRAINYSIISQADDFSKDYAVNKHLYKNIMPTSSSYSSPAPVITSSSSVYSSFHCDTSQNNASEYDASLYSSSVLLEDDRGVVVFKAANTVPQKSEDLHGQTVNNSNVSNSCCSPLEINPCQSCSPSVKSKNSNQESSNRQHFDASNVMSSSNQAEDVAQIPGNRKPQNSFEEPYALFQDPVLKKCPICLNTYSASEIKLHIRNCYSYNMSKEIDLNTPKNLRENLTPSDFKNSSINSLHFNCAKKSPTDVYNKNWENKAMHVTENSQNENNLKICMNLMNNTPLENIVECFEHVENSMAYGDESSRSFSKMLEEDIQSEFPTEVKNNGDNSTTSNVKKFNFDVSLVQNKSERTNEKNEYLDFLNAEKRTTNGLPESFNLKDYSMINGSKTFNLNQEGVNINRPCRKMNKCLYCKICEKKFCRRGALRKHIQNFHPLSDVNNSIGLCKEEMPLISHSDIYDSNEASVNENNYLQNETSVNENHYIQDCNKIIVENNKSPSKVFDFDHNTQINKNVPSYKSYMNQTRAIPSVTNAEFKNKIETLNELKMNFPSSIKTKLTKTPLKQCIYCGKFLTAVYMKQHISKMHSNISKYQNSIIVHHSNKIDNSPPVSDEDKSFLLIPSHPTEEDIDSNTCLSVSDALNSQEKYNTPSTNIEVSSNYYSKDSEPSFGINDKLPHSTTNLGYSNELQINLQNKQGFNPNTDMTSSHYTCHLCFRNYTAQLYLNKHIRTYHGIHNSSESVKNDLGSPDSVDSRHSQVEFQSSMGSGDGSLSSCNFIEDNSNLFTNESEKSLVASQNDGSLYSMKEYNIGECFELSNSDLFNSVELNSVDGNKNISPDFSDSSPYYQDNNLHNSPKLKQRLSPPFERIKSDLKKSYVVDANEIIESNEDLFVMHRKESNSFKTLKCSSVQVQREEPKDQELVKSKKEELIESEKEKLVESEKDLICSKIPVYNKINFKKKFYCQYCLRRYSSKVSLRHHMKLKHTNLPIIIKTLPKNLLSVATLPKSLLSVAVFPKNLSVIATIPKSSPPVTLEKSKVVDELFDYDKGCKVKSRCKFCFKIYSNRGNLRMHMRRIHNYVSVKRNVNEVQCNICFKLLASNSLKSHIKLMHGDAFLNSKINRNFSTNIRQSSNFSNGKEKLDKFFQSVIGHRGTELTVSSLINYKSTIFKIKDTNLTNRSETKAAPCTSALVNELYNDTNSINILKPQSKSGELTQVLQDKTTRSSSDGKLTKNMSLKDPDFNIVDYNRCFQSANNSVDFEISNHKDRRKILKLEKRSTVLTSESSHNNSTNNISSRTDVKLNSLLQSNKCNGLQQRNGASSGFCIDTQNVDSSLMVGDKLSESLLSKDDCFKNIGPDSTSATSFRLNCKLCAKKSFGSIKLFKIHMQNCHRNDSSSSGIISGKSLNKNYEHCDVSSLNSIDLSQNHPSVKSIPSSTMSENILADNTTTCSKFNKSDLAADSLESIEKCLGEANNESGEANNESGEACFDKKQSSDSFKPLLINSAPNERPIIIPLSSSSFENNVTPEINTFNNDENFENEIIKDRSQETKGCQSESNLIKTNVESDIQSLLIKQHLNKSNLPIIKTVEIQDGENTINQGDKSLEMKKESGFETHEPLENYVNNHNIVESRIKISESTSSVGDRIGKQESRLEELNDSHYWNNISANETASESCQEISKSSPELSKTHYNKCRLCHKVFRTMMSLSKHLKIVHQIPVLKKQLRPAQLIRNDEKLSPPHLSHQPDYLDSAPLVSKLQNLPNSRSICCSSENNVIESKPESAILSGEPIRIHNSLVVTTLKNSTLSNLLNLQRSNSSISDQQINSPAEPRVKSASENSAFEYSKKINLPNSSNSFSSNEIFLDSVNKIDMKQSHQISSDFITATNSDADNKIQALVDKNFTVEHSNLKTPVLPKCVIKVLKNERNAVTYKIDHSNEQAVFKSSGVKSDIANGKLSQHFANRKQCVHRFGKTMFSSTLKSRTHSKRKNFFNKRSLCFSFSPKKKRQFFNSRKGFLKKIALNISNTKSNALHSSAILTFEDPQEIAKFLKENNQPVVQLTRLKEVTFENDSVKANSNKCSSVAIYNNIDIDKVPIVKLEKIDILGKLTQYQNQSVPEKLIFLPNSSRNNVHVSDEIPVHQTMNSQLQQNSDMQENIDANVLLCNVNKGNCSTNKNYVEDRIKFQNKCKNLPHLKECKVVLNKLVL